MADPDAMHVLVNSALCQTAAGWSITRRLRKDWGANFWGGEMSRDGAMIFGDLVGKLPVYRVSCTKRPRQGRYILFRLLRAHGHNAKVIDWVDVITADCPKRIAKNTNDQCGVRCPELPKVLSLFPHMNLRPFGLSALVY